MAEEKSTVPADEVWQAIQQVSRLLDSNFPTRRSLQLLVDNLKSQSGDTQLAMQTNVEYVRLSMDDILRFMSHEDDPKAALSKSKVQE